MPLRQPRLLGAVRLRECAARAGGFAWTCNWSPGVASGGGGERNEVDRAFQWIGSYLGAGIANIVNVFNPEIVIIGNRMSLAEPWIGESMRETVAKRTLPYHRRSMRILFAELKEQSAVLGAASYAIERFFVKIKGGGAAQAG